MRHIMLKKPESITLRNTGAAKSKRAGENGESAVGEAKAILSYRAFAI